MADGNDRGRGLVLTEGRVAIFLLSSCHLAAQVVAARRARNRGKLRHSTAGLSLGRKRKCGSADVRGRIQTTRDETAKSRRDGKEGKGGRMPEVRTTIRVRLIPDTQRSQPMMLTTPTGGSMAGSDASSIPYANDWAL